MLVLAAETSTQKGSVALARDGKILGQKINLIQKSHSEVVHSLIDQLLKEHSLQLKDIDVFAASAGPGSFTGLRIAGNTMKSFCYALNKPMVVIDSLTLMAEAFPSDGMISPWINAYKNMVYWAMFEKKNGELTQIHEPAVIRVQELQTILTKPTFILGDGFKVYKDFLSENVTKFCLRPENDDFDHPYASTLALLSTKYAKLGRTIDWNSYKPLYIRASEAEENKSGILFTSLT